MIQHSDLKVTKHLLRRLSPIYETSTMKDFFEEVHKNTNLSRSDIKTIYQILETYEHLENSLLDELKIKDKYLVFLMQLSKRADYVSLLCENNREDLYREADTYFKNLTYNRKHLDSYVNTAYALEICDYDVTQIYINGLPKHKTLIFASLLNWLKVRNVKRREVE